MKELESNKIEHRIEKFDNERLSITAFSQYDAYVDQTNEVYYFSKRNNKMICESITVNDPKNYQGKRFWTSFMTGFDNGAYENTGIRTSLDEPLYKSVKGKFRTDHYLSLFYLGDEIILLSFDLDQPRLNTDTF
ncbi:hypothetical protein [Epilithonimonas mollis]|nr:hypothetical protein [Epilithonimonas mollis]